MRPRKTVYLIDHRPVEFSVMSMRLYLWGFRVLPAGHPSAPHKGSDDPVLDLVLCFLPPDHAAEWATYAQWVGRVNDARVILVGSPQDLYGHTAHAALPLSTSQAEMREMLMIQASRKRGPKGDHHRVQFAASAEPVHAPRREGQP